MLIREAAAGERVVLTAGRRKIPAAELVAIKPKVTKRLGVIETPGFRLPADFFEPFPNVE
jgi:antitoxin (DNA-binding transcriptional repressor) of toxin-antitoxin stability system